MTLEQLFAALRGTPAPAVGFPPSPAPWYTRVLLGAMGWLGGLFVLGFFGAIVSGLFKSPVGMTVIAVLLFVAAHGMYRRFPESDFATQSALAASICAQVLMVMALADVMGRSERGRGVALFAGLMQVVLVVVMPNYVHRLLSTMFAVMALWYAAGERTGAVLVVGGVAVALVALWRREGALIAAGRRPLLEPVFTGLAVGLLASGIAFVRLLEGRVLVPFPAASAAVLAACLVAFVALRTGALKERPYALVAALAFAVAAHRAPGLLAALLVLFIAVDSGRRVLAGLAMAALVAYFSTYYYQMDITLAAKSGVLAASGVVLLAAWWVLRRFAVKEAP